MYRFFSYKIFSGVFIVLTLIVVSCRTSASATSGTGNNKKPDEKTQILLENLFIDGCKERLAGKIENSEALFRQCQKIDPQNVAVKYELANLLRLTGRIDEALKLSKECVDAEPKNQWFHIAYIDGLHQKKQFLQAAEAYEKLVKIFPSRNDLIEAMAIDYAMGQNYSKAFKIYEDLEKRYGNNETFTINKIKLLKEQRKFNEAEAELKKLIETNSLEPRYYYYLSEYYEEMQQFEKAMGVYEKILTLDPNNSRVHLAIANYYKDQNKAEQAHNEFKIAFAGADLEVDTKLKILISYYSISEEYAEYTLKGYELCKIMLKVHPYSPEAHSIYADFLLRDKKTEEARNHYLIAAFNDKNRFAIWNQLLFVESGLNQNDSLARHSSVAMDLFPNQPSPYFFNGAANIQLKNYDKAIQSLSDGLEFVYDNKRLMFDFYRQLGDVYYFTKQYEKSDKAYEDALKIDPDDAVLLNNYSYYLSLRKEKLDKAERFSKRSNEISPNNPIFIDTYGWILFQQKKYKEAEEWLSMALKLGGQRANILEHYGDVLFRLNRIEEAVKYWKLSLDAGNKSDELLAKISAKKISE